MNGFWITVLAAFHLMTMIECSGVFELKILGLENPLGRDSTGECCSSDGSDVPPGSPCPTPCPARLRACLKHYQAQVDTTSPCTFGDFVTPVLGSNSLKLAPSGHLISFPFDFTWPGTFSLIVEAWHDTNGTSRLSGNKRLITRLTSQRWLDVGSEWTPGASDGALRFEYRVTCEPHYYGPGCATLCRPRDDNFGHYTCSETGARICTEGWTGDYCSQPKCLPGCDSQHGHCNSPNECSCYSGWKGPLCDECERYPGCLHGSCKKPWDCLCDEGWGGLFCNQDLNYCTNHRPCRHGGTCFNTGQGSYTCACPPGYTGNDCEVKIDGCSHTPCLNGAKCVDEGRGGYQCDCSVGWQGTHCEISAVTCGDFPCQNSGICEDTQTGYKCTCMPGFAGHDCSDEVDLCQCQNGATCTPEGTCVCLSGYTGNRCETNIDDCAHSPCLNGATCIDGVNTFKCQCVPGYVGQLCQDEVDYCIAKPCANGGTCSKHVNDYKCVCKPGFTGKDCSVDVDECAPAPCKNGGRCTDRVNGFICTCPSGFNGPTCSDEPGRPSNSSKHVLLRRRDDSALSAQHLVIIVTVSVSVPLIAIIATVLVRRLKQRRALERRKADDEARRQNEQNSVSSAVIGGKRIDSAAHMIKNTWSTSTSTVGSGAQLGKKIVDDHVQVTSSSTEAASTWDPVYVAALQRTRSQKQLNTDVSRQQQQRSSSKDLLNGGGGYGPSESSIPPLPSKRMSVLSLDSTGHPPSIPYNSSCSDMSSSGKQRRSSALDMMKSAPQPVYFIGGDPHHHPHQRP
ncbi:N terminus of Notch ligand [Nesidiocoris tenuis]|uniref:Delta-like protein n=1 Tax=Nesidiocoris tenuis TaxID=355587 RepID=A0ABN7APE8_9HEMI|nr:N terminus of Notch ligand [Nesidiocoris tenuis]